jgi:hypothetical protein
MCDVCGFTWDSVGVRDVAGRLGEATRSFIEVVTDAGPLVARRPSPARWSVLEYAGHLRDVLISLRERVIAATIVEHPTGAAMHRDERVALGLYHGDAPDDVAREISVLSALFVKTLAAVPAKAFDRTMTYSPVTPQVVTITWVAAQAVHEAEHHLDDVRENLSLLGR